MKSKIKKSIEKVLFVKKKLGVKNSFYNRHNKIFKNGEFKLKSLTEDEKKAYIKYWEVLSKDINLKTVEISKSLSGKFDKRIIPEEIFSLYIEPYLNIILNATFIENKNIYNKWFGEGIFPKDYFHKINNVYYDSQLNIIQNIEMYLSKIDIDFPVVFKPSIESFGGKDVFFLNSNDEIMDLIPNFKNFVLQEKLLQHKEISNIYPDSINTIRVCLLRRPISSEVIFLNASLRMGKDGSLDNETAGGIVNNISSSGILNDYSVDKFGRKYFYHPNSNTEFKGIIIPQFKDLQECAIKIGEKIIHSNLISLDMCLDNESKWRCIEVNLAGQTIRFAQYAGNPFLGNYTDEIISYLKERN